MNELKIRMKVLAEELSQAFNKYSLLTRDLECGEEQPGPPCSPAQLQQLQAIFGGPLPPSYQAFMELHNGWARFHGEADLLAVEDYGAPWLRDLLSDLDDHFREFGAASDKGPQNPVAEGAHPVLLGASVQFSMYIDCSSRRPDGEMDCVTYDHGRVEDRFESFEAFLRAQLEIVRELIEDEERGV